MASLGLDEDGACDLLAGLTPSDFAERILSEHTAEWMYVIKPVVASTRLYVKVIIRGDCVVISLHGDEVPDEQADE